MSSHDNILEIIKQHLDIIEVAGHYADRLIRSGSAYKTKCVLPTHDDRTPSFLVSQSTQKFKCFGCGEHGDVIDLISKVEQIPIAEVIKRESVNLGLSGSSASKKNHYSKYAGSRILRSSMNAAPSARDLFAPQKPDISVNGLKAGINTPVIFNPKPGLEKPLKSYKPVAVYPYRDIDGDLLGYVIRCEWPKMENGKPVRDGQGKSKISKFTPQIAWGEYEYQGEVKKGWGFMSLREAYGEAPFLGWEEIDPNDNKPLVFFEGEKAHRAGAELFPFANAVAWPGGTGNIEDTETNRPYLAFEKFASRFGHKRCYLFPDADKTGYKAMLKVARQLSANGMNNIRIVDIANRGLEKGWDIADLPTTENLTLEDVTLWVKGALAPADFAANHNMQEILNPDPQIGRNEKNTAKKREITVRSIYDNIINIEELVQALAMAPRDIVDESMVDRYLAMTSLEFQGLRKGLYEKGLDAELTRLQTVLAARGVNLFIDDDVDGTENNYPMAVPGNIKG